MPTGHERVSQLVKSRAKTPRLHEGLTSLAGVWSELILRDISSNVRPELNEDCCSFGNHHPECFPSFNKIGQCSNYMRHVPTLSIHSCHFKFREQMNGASGYLDGSDIYGNNDDRLHKLRTYHSGKVNAEQCEICRRQNSSIGRYHKHYG